MTKHILVIAGCFPSLYPRASRPLNEDETMPEERKQFMLKEFGREIYVYEVCDSECVCYLPEEEVLHLIREHGWPEITRLETV